MLMDAIKRTADELCALGPRPMGSIHERRAAAYLQERLAALGFQPEQKTFASPAHYAVSARLEACETGEAWSAEPILFSGSGEVKGKLVYLGALTAAASVDSGPSDIHGCIGLVVSRADERVQAAILQDWIRRGLAAVVIASPHGDTVLTSWLEHSETMRMPMLAVPWPTANALAAREGQRFSLAVKGEEVRAGESQNVVAELNGSGLPWVWVSANYDTAPDTVGAVDNGGGVAVLLEVARQMASQAPYASVLFTATGSGAGARGGGAEAFLQGQCPPLERCVGHIAISQVGHRLGVPEIVAGGNTPFFNAVVSTEHSAYSVTRAVDYDADHGAAARRGIPYAWFSDARALSPACCKSSGDDPAFLASGRLRAHAASVVQAVLALAANDPFFPFVRSHNRVIRPVRLADLPAIAHITEQAFGPVSMARMQEELFQEQLGGKPWHVYKNRELASAIRKQIYQGIVCEIAGQVVGYATALYDSEKGIAVIGNNAVDPDFQGQGVGSALQQEIQRRMIEEGYTRFAVQTLSNDIPAQRMYARLGYCKYIETYHYLKEQMQRGQH